MECPCIDCVCAPICRHKLYGYLFSDCALLRRYILKYDVVHLRDEAKMKTMIRILNPTHWKYEFDLHYNSKFPVVQATVTNKEVAAQLRKGDTP